MASALVVRYASYAALVSPLINQQVPFDLEAVVDHMKHVLDTRGHLVICMAEGAGQVGGLLNVPTGGGSCVQLEGERWLHCSWGCTCPVQRAPAVFL